VLAGRDIIIIVVVVAAVAAGVMAGDGRGVRLGGVNRRCRAAAADQLQSTMSFESRWRPAGI
jgi:hypothetical protein